MTEDPLTSCPDCSGPVKKLVSISSFQLKGGGWYSDGYSSKSSDGSCSAVPDKPIEKSIEKPTEKSPEKSAEKSAKSGPAKTESTTSSSSDSSATTKTKANTSATA